MRTLLALLTLTAVALAEDDGQNEFAHDLFARLAAREGNIVCSPMSVRVALAMVYGGARGQTADEMKRVLRCDAGIDDEMAALVRGYDGKAGMPALANAAWLQEGTALLPGYVELVTAKYGAPPAALDFRKPDAACGIINRWVAGRTHDRIREIVSPDMLNPNSRLVLANALHFKAAWHEPFGKALTRERPFVLASGEKVSVPFMVQAEHHPYAERDGAQAVELPYEGGRFSMVLVLPPAGTPTAVPAGLLDSLKGTNVSVQMPRFRFECGFRLEETLAAMGMKSAFGRGADFSGMDGTTGLFIGFVAHKAMIAVDEDGTEAAAATAAGMERKGAAGKPVVFLADRPFLFLIRDRKTGAILFLGRVSDPTAR